MTSGQPKVTPQQSQYNVKSQQFHRGAMTTPVQRANWDKLQRREGVYCPEPIGKTSIPFSQNNEPVAPQQNIVPNMPQSNAAPINNAPTTIEPNVNSEVIVQSAAKASAPIPYYDFTHLEESVKQNKQSKDVKKEKPVGFLSWLLTVILLVIPVVNLVLLVMYVFGFGGNKTRCNFFRVIFLLLVVAIGALLLFIYVTYGIGAIEFFELLIQYYFPQ